MRKCRFSAEATRITFEIVRKHPDQVGFTVHPRGWVIERFFAWIGRNRRLGREFDATLASAEGFLYAASVMLLVRCQSALETDPQSASKSDPPFRVRSGWIRRGS